MKQPFKVKSENPKYSGVICRGKCLCEEEYTEEIEKNCKKHVEVNITTQQKKLIQHDTYRETSLTCLCEKFRYLLEDIGTPKD